MIAVLYKRSIAAVAIAAFISICLIYSLGASTFNLPGVVDIGLGGNENVPIAPAEPTVKTDDKFYKDLYEANHPGRIYPPKVEKPAPVEEQPEQTTEDEAAQEPEKEVEKPKETEKKPDPNAERLAFATFLSGTLDHDEDLDHDNYFIATRLLCWQLLHSPRTKVRDPNIDVVVMVTPSVSESRKERLKKDGALVIPVDSLHAEWLKKTSHEKRWDELMAKLRAWQMTQYNRILLLDGDIILQSPLDAIFADPGAQIKPALDPKTVKNKDAVPKGAPPLPKHYLLGGLGETHNHIHDYPPSWENGGLQKPGYFNAGFFMLHPSEEAFAYYNHILQTPDSFEPTYMEQNLLNMVHNWDGPLPWSMINVTWNIARVNDNDLDQGVVSAHDKWWKDPLSNSTRIRDLFHQQRWEMQGWYDALDSLEGR